MEKEKVLSIRMSECEREQITEMARCAGYSSVSNYVRYKLFHDDRDYDALVQIGTVEKRKICMGMIRMQHYIDELPLSTENQKDGLLKEVNEIWHTLN